MPDFIKAYAPDPLKFSPDLNGDDRIAKSFAFWQNLADVAPEFFLRFKGGIPGLITKLGLSARV